MMRKMRRWIAYMLSFCMICGAIQMMPGDVARAQQAADGEIDDSTAGKQVVRYLTGTETASGDNTYLASDTERLTDFFAGAGSMKWSVTFKTGSSSLQGLLMLERDDQYYALYAGTSNGNTVLGFENKTPKTALTGNADFDDNQWHTAELEMIEGEALVLRMDGAEVARSESPALLKDLSWTPTAFTIGGAKDYSSASGWKLEGSVKDVVLEKEVLPNPVWRAPNLPDSQISVENGAGLNECSFTMAYRLKEEAGAKTDLMTFGGLSLFADPANGKAGFGETGAVLAEGTAQTDLGTTKWHQAAIVKSAQSLELYVDGVMVGNAAHSGALDFSSIQKGAGVYCSDARLYGEVLTPEQIDKMHADTRLSDYPDPVPKLQGYYKGENREIFNAGFDGSVAYRIPAITTSEKTGTVVAAIDKRWTTSADTGINDTVIRRSEDNGETWGPVIPVIDMPDADAYTIDPEIVTDNDPDSEHYGRIYILVDLNRNGTDLWHAVDGTGYAKIDGKDYQILTDESGNTYTIREQGVVFDSENNPTEYRVETEAEAPYKMQGALYKNGAHIGSIYKNAELTMIDTVYLWMTYSDDDGKTWSRPKDLTPMVKADWMSFFGVGPGAGVQLKNGAHKGRLIFTMYAIKHGADRSGFSSYNVYSDDDGETWHRGGSPNPNPSASARELNESCIVELDNGHLIQFMKNATDQVATAVSEDGGETWSDVSYQQGIREVYCEMSVLHYGDLYDPKDGQTKEAIIFANPSGTTGNGRNHGRVRIAFVNDDDTLDWAYDKLIEEENFLYNSMTLMEDGNIGMIYENEKGSSTSAAFTSFSPQYIMDENVYDNTPQPTGIDVEILNASGQKEQKLRAGSRLNIKIAFDRPVFAAGNATSNVKVGDAVKEAELVGNEGSGTLVFRYELQAGDTGDVTATGEVNVKEGGVAETIYNVPLTSKPFVTVTAPLGKVQAEGFSQLPTDGMTASAGSEHTSDLNANEGPAAHVLNDNRSKYWHTKWNADNAPAGRPKHYITLDLGGAHQVSGLTYLPRENGGNGTITKYQVEVSADGETFYPYEQGDWALNGDLKKTYFRYGPVSASHVRLRSLESSGNVSSAAAIRIIGSSQTGGADGSIRLALVQTLLLYEALEEKFATAGISSLSQAMNALKEAASKENVTQAEADAATNALNAAVGAVLEDLDTAISDFEQKEEGSYTASSWGRYRAAVMAAQELVPDAGQYEKLVAYLDIKEAEARLKAASVSKVFVKNVAVTSEGGVTELARADVPATLQLFAAITPDNATDGEVVWRSDDKSKATVDQNGLVTTARKTGEVTITAATKDGSCRTGTIALTITGEDEADVITVPQISYAKPASGGYPMPADVAAGSETSSHHEQILDSSENPVELASASGTPPAEPVKYVDGVWAINDQLIAPASGDDDKFNIEKGTPAVIRFKLYMKRFNNGDNNNVFVSKGDIQYHCRLLSNGGNEGIAAYAGPGYNIVNYRYKDADKTEYSPALNEWADVMQVIDTDGKTRLYVNGEASWKGGDGDTGTSQAKDIAKTSGRFAIGGRNEPEGSSSLDRKFTSDQGYLADVQFYSGAEMTAAQSASIHFGTLDAAYDTDAKKWAYLSGLLDSVGPTANYTGMPYDIKTEWRAGAGAVLAPGEAFEDNAAYSATTTFTAHEGFVFPTEAADKAAFEDAVKAAVRAGNAAAPAGSVEVDVESAAVMKVVYTGATGSGEQPAGCSCAIETLTVEPAAKTISIAADGSNNTLQLSALAAKTGGCGVDGHPAGNEASYRYEVTDAGTTGASVSANGLVTAQEAGTAVIRVTAALASGTASGKEKSEDVSVTVTKEAGGGNTETYTVTFHKNDGSGATASAEIAKGSKILPSDFPDWAQDTKTHKFAGWFTDEACGEAYDLNAPVTGKLPLYAKWEEKTSEDAEADEKADAAIRKAEELIAAGGGSIGSNDRLPTKTQDGEPLEWKAESEHVSIGPDGEVTVAESLTEEIEVTFTVTLFYGDGKRVIKSITARVRPVTPAARYTVTFHAAGGAPTPAKQTTASGGKVKKPANPTKAGHTFVGWYLGAKAYDFDAPVTGDLVLTAKWTANSYKIRFYANGTGVRGMPGEVTKKYNETLLLSTVKTPARDGCKFLGWSKSAGGAVIASLKVTANAGLYARWEKLPKDGATMTDKKKKITYRMISESKKTAMVAKGTSKKARSVSIPAEVTIEGVKCKVVTIGKNAFKGYSKMTKVTLGKNVTAIEQNAFSGCKKLKDVILKGKALKSVKKGAFKSTAKNLKVKAPKGMKKAAKNKLLRAIRSAGNKKAKIK